MKSFFQDTQAGLYLGDALEVLAKLKSGQISTIVADPPYFLSGGGSTCSAGKRAKVAKGHWDAPRTPQDMLTYNLAWLGECKRVLHDDGTIWVSGTMHNIYSVGYAMQVLGYRVLNEIAWIKPNPPPNLGRRCFTHAHETIVWASKARKARHCFAYDEMRAENGGKQMRTDWRFTTARPSERTHGKHPTQKPIALVERMLRASCPPDGMVLDPFCGSGTTGVAARRLGLHFIGVDIDRSYLEIARARLLDAA